MTDYVRTLVYVYPLVGGISGPDTEGLLFFRIKKSDLSITASGFVGKQQYLNIMRQAFGDFSQH
ncbi:MAG: hypothetical protein LBB19_01085 [Puniceicoccales bacterium]|jgi:hypothetical protein|nr:hypothetical protein [Puniceicoccales bacterium]